MKMQDVLGRLNDDPFKPFRIHMSDGTTYDVLNHGFIIVGPSSAVVTREYAKDEDGRMYAKHWRTIALAHIVQMSDLTEHRNGRGRRRKAG
jgi:hypothetical protein